MRESGVRAWGHCQNAESPELGPSPGSVFGKLLGKRVTVPRRQRSTAMAEVAPVSPVQLPSPISAVAEATAAEVLSSLKDSFLAM